MKHRRAKAMSILSLIAILINAWILIWSRRGAIFWGIGKTEANILAIILALCGVMALLIKPIPVKVTAIATYYMLIFSLLIEVAFSIIGMFNDYFIALRNCALIPPALTLAFIVYAFIHGKKTVLTHYTITSDLVKYPMKIALISDVHMGLSVDAKRLQRAVDSLIAEEPDLLVIAGDLVDDQTTPEQMDTACKILGRAKVTQGIWFIYGNHDIAAVGPRLAFSAEQYRKTLTENGINILDDKCVLLEGTATLVGRLDMWTDKRNQRMELGKLLRGLDRSLPVILLDHQPNSIEEAVDSGVFLQLSGHTHGGQVWPAGALSSLLRPKSIVYGHRCVNGCHVIVSSGLGTRGSTLRSGCTSETVLINILPE